MTNQKVVLITGASSGIGQATAQLLEDKGFTVFGTSRKPDTNVHPYQMLPLDVRSDTSVQTAVQSILDQTGRLDVLINNAGYGQFGAIEENNIADMQVQFDTNVFGLMRVTNAVLPIMRRQAGGRIINVSSVLGHVALAYAGLYASSKFAVEGISEALRQEVLPFNIHVSMVEPSWVKSDFHFTAPAHPIADYASARQATLQRVNSRVAIGTRPDEVAQTILQVVTSPRPRLHYLVGGQAQLVTAFKRLLPEPLFEQVWRRMSS